MKVLIRADSSSSIGTGHIMRDLVLAQQYAKRGDDVIFAARNLEGNINQRVLEDGYALKILKSTSKKELRRVIKDLRIDLLIVDNYAINYKKEKYLKTKTGVKILAVDDTYEKHYCDILLNHNISANKKRYKRLVPKGCELRCGKKYTLLRDEFYKAKQKKYKKDTATKHIFIAMGGADTAELNIRLLKILEDFKGIRVAVVTTSANKHLKELQSYATDKEWIELHINSKKMAKLMAKSDLAIVTPSVTVNEVCFMELPFIAIKTADNQNDIYQYLKKKRFKVIKKFKRKTLLRTLKGMLL
jgi:UDP-2,4-diacetamido-2,4,6-trideoxy-beta-L-altropyranose hydrolase